jgi:hypothetical protein
MAIDQASSGEEARRYMSNSRMLNFRSDMDRRLLDPSGSLLVIDLRNPPSTAQPTRNGSWSNTWPLLVLYQILFVELESLDERVCGKRSYSLYT